MRTVYLYGQLADDFGPSFRLRANTLGAVVKLLEANFPGQFMRHVMNGYYRVVAGASLDDVSGIQFEESLARSGLNLGSKDVHIMPVPEGSGGNGFKILAGVALVAAAFTGVGLAAGGAFSAVYGPSQGLAAAAFSVGGFSVSYGSIALFGANLLISGIAGMLTPTPKISPQDYSQREQADQRPSYIFNGAVNTVEQGGPIPVVYGRMYIGSTVISGGIKAEQI